MKIFVQEHMFLCFKFEENGNHSNSLNLWSHMPIKNIKYQILSIKMIRHMPQKCVKEFCIIIYLLTKPWILRTAFYLVTINLFMTIMYPDL